MPVGHPPVNFSLPNQQLGNREGRDGGGPRKSSRGKFPDAAFLIVGCDLRFGGKLNHSGLIELGDVPWGDSNQDTEEKKNRLNLLH